jgi:hypothetical protein
VALLFAVGVAAIAAMQGDATTLAGVSAVLASLRLTWKALGATLGRAVRKVEQPLWGAEIDRLVTRAMLIPPRQAACDRTAERRRLAEAWVRGPATAQGPR